METNIENFQKTTDLSYLIELSAGNKVFVKEMVALFLSENPEEIRTMERGIAEKNFKTIRTVAHKLRSTIPFIGLDKFIEKDIAEIESIATDSGDMKEIDTRFKKIKSVCEKAYFELSPLSTII